jgi:eukaryotic-like serine/threonine-protein kinase
MTASSASLPPFDPGEGTDDPPPTTRIGRYELLFKLAVGGMGSVYVGRQRGAAGFERLVAVKRMHSHVAQTPEMLAGFLDEARIASLIHHPNVVRVQDVYESEGECLLVMDYVDGVALSGLLWSTRRRGEPPPPRVALRIMVDVLLGLHAAHELKSLDGAPMQVVHRDVSPHNVLLGADDGVARVTDFGIARAAGRANHTRAGQVKGKLRYMAPEQATEQAVDRRADLFSAAVVLFELLAGRRFLQGENDAKILLEITVGSYPDLAEVRPGLPPELCALVARGLARSPDDRWPTALAFAQALEGFGRAADCLAHHAEVAAFVIEACGDQVRALRESVSVALRRPAEGPPTARSMPPAKGPRVARRSAHSSHPPATSKASLVTATHTAASPRPRRFWPYVVALGGVAFSAALSATIAFRAPHPATDPGAAEPTARLPAPPAASVRVSIVSDAGVRAIEAPPSVDVRATPEGATLLMPKSAGPVRLTITLADGQRVFETVYPDENSTVHVRALREGARPAPDAPSASAPARSSARPPPRPPPPNPGLKKNPYE